MTNPSALVLGSTGAIGTACTDRFSLGGFTVATPTRMVTSTNERTLAPDWISNLGLSSIDAVVWAQGANGQGALTESSADDLTQLFQANVAFVADTARELLAAGVLAASCRFVVVSSIWQEVARQQKFAYIVSKSAVGGLVRSMAFDLAEHGVSVNAVLPGVVDTPMTRENLSDSQLARITADTPLGRLVSLTDVANAVFWLASPESTGITGQFITVDGGWSTSRYV